MCVNFVWVIVHVRTVFQPAFFAKLFVLTIVQSVDSRDGKICKNWRGRGKHKMDILWWSKNIFFGWECAKWKEACNVISPPCSVQSASLQRRRCPGTKCLDLRLKTGELSTPFPFFFPEADLERIHTDAYTHSCNRAISDIPVAHYIGFHSNTPQHWCHQRETQRAGDCDRGKVRCYELMSETTLREDEGGGGEGVGVG